MNFNINANVNIIKFANLKLRTYSKMSIVLTYSPDNFFLMMICKMLNKQNIYACS
jgi:hypothetical protein